MHGLDTIHYLEAEVRRREEEEQEEDKKLEAYTSGRKIA